MEAGKIVYYKGGFVPAEEATVSVMNHSFNYGSAIFEGVRGYWSEGENQLYIFRLREHMERMLRNFRIFLLNSPLSIDELCENAIELCRLNGFREGIYIRPIGYRPETSLSPGVENLGTEITMFILTLGDYVDVEKGLKVRVSSWRRPADNAIPSRAKITGAYANSGLAIAEAHLGGYDDTIMLREDGSVSEGSAMNIFLVRDGRLVTSPVSSDILEGITRSTVMQIAEEQLGIETDVRVIGRTELYVADEIFFVGTGAQVAPVIQVDGRDIGDGSPGEVTMRLQRPYFDVVHGRVEKYRHWVTPVY